MKITVENSVLFNYLIFERGVKLFFMERLLGIFLSILGVTGLILAVFNFMSVGRGTISILEISLYGVLGAIFFFGGISLVRDKRDETA
jgi:hypothetical protein